MMSILFAATYTGRPTVFCHKLPLKWIWISRLGSHKPGIRSLPWRSTRPCNRPTQFYPDATSPLDLQVMIRPILHNFSLCSRWPYTMGETWGMANDGEWRTVQYFVERVKVIKRFHHKMLTPPVARVNITKWNFRIIHFLGIYKNSFLRKTH